jgi:hypothetical protein
MKTINIALLLFPIAILGNPNIPIEVKANTCSKAPGIGSIGCDYDPWHLEHKITVPDVKFSVECYVMAKAVSGLSRWNWVPSWRCWVSESYTDKGCEGKS